MPKAGELDWSDLFKTGTVQKEDELSKSLGESQGKKGEDATALQLAELLQKKNLLQPLPDGLRQPTDEELFGGLVVSEEEMEKREKDWQNKINDFYKAVQKPVEDQGSHANKNWGTRGDIQKEQLTEEEERIRQIPVDPRLTNTD